MRARASILLLSSLLGCAAPKGHGGSGEEEEDDEDGRFEPAPLIALSLAARPDNALIADAHVTVVEPASVVIELWSDAVEPLRTLATPRGASHAIAVVGMRPESEYRLRAVATTADGAVLTSEEVSFETGALPPGFPAFTVSGDATPDGVTIVGATDSRGGSPVPLFFGVDGMGEVVWYYSPADLAQDADALRSAERMSDGSLLLVLDRVFRRITPGGRILSELSGGDIDQDELHHDADPMPDGHMVVLTKRVATMEAPPFDEPVPVAWDLLVEIDANQDVVWEWSSFDHLEHDRWPNTIAHVLDERNGYADWTHANSVYYDQPNDQFIVSLRHQNWVIAVDHATGDINWRLGFQGDFALEGGGEWFNSQHAATLSGDAVLVYDNGNEKHPPESRAVRYELDHEARSARQVWEWRAGTYTTNLGDADLLPDGNTLVCVGGEQPSGEPTRIVEVDPAGAPVWSLVLEDGLWAYRATRVVWLTPAP